MPKAFIGGCAGHALSTSEIDFFSSENPWGLILFARNCDTPEQITSLVTAFRNCVSRENAPVLIDQEGGRVQRLGPPHWQSYPAGCVFGALDAESSEVGADTARNVSRLIAQDLHTLGINVDCLPILDVPQADGHDIIGDRAYGNTPEQVARIGRAVCEGLRAGGVLPVIKHIPGHGRARADSHASLPVVDASKQELRDLDFRPFKELNDMPMAMTAHIVYSAFDDQNPATQSTVLINDVIRTELGFDGLIMTDDLSMKALTGSFGERARKSLHAGCDLVLHCNGELSEMEAVAGAVPNLAGAALRRADAALEWVSEPAPFDTGHAMACLERARLAV
jgi:beta-N-acetylhexosaminidase